jgi:Ulp1 family protease
MSKGSKMERDIAAQVADIHGVTPDHVRKVRRGDRVNQSILNTYMELLEGKNKLIQAVKELVPFN